MKPLHEIKQDVVRVCRRLDEREYVGGRDGNVSVRLSARAILVTPAGMRKGDIGVHDLLVVDAGGTKIEGRGRPSTETGMHVHVYRRRSDVGSIVHAHPPVATGFAAAGRGLTGCVLPEVIVGLGEVPLVPYALPGTEDVAQAIDPFLERHDALLLGNHGAVAFGEDVDAAHQRMETLEQSSRILLVARLLGGPNPLGAEEVQRLLKSRARYGVREDLAACDVGERGDPGEDALVERIAARILGSMR